MKIIPKPRTGTAKETAANLRKVGERVPLALASALYAEGHGLIADAMPLTPLRDKMGGSLRASNFVGVPTISGGRATMEVGFGGAATKYALFVHEMTGSNINWSEPGTGAKYLERPFDQLQPKLANNLAQRMAAFLKRNGFTPAKG